MSGAEMAGQRITAPLFLLGTVLFPDVLRPSKIFRQRYVGMAGVCVTG